MQQFWKDGPTYVLKDFGDPFVIHWWYLGSFINMLRSNPTDDSTPFEKMVPLVF